MQDPLSPSPPPPTAPATTLAQDLASRWSRARRAALAAVVLRPVADDESESWLARLALSVDREHTLRRVYDHGHRLALGFARYYRQDLTPNALPALLGHLDAPCLQGVWSPQPHAHGTLVSRPPCEAAADPGLCDYWREALGGLAHGLGEDLRHTRHASGHTGAARCQDAFYEHAESPLRYGPIPRPLRPALDAAAVALRMVQPHSTVRFLGLCEDELIISEETTGCPAAGEDALAHEDRLGVLRGIIARFAPGIRIKDASPRAVLAADLGETTASPAAPA